MLGANGFQNSDIDMFIYGLTEEEAVKKVEEILSCICKNTKDTGHLVVSQHSITLLGVYPFRHVQIVLRLYRYIDVNELLVTHE